MAYKHNNAQIKNLKNSYEHSNRIAVARNDVIRFDGTRQNYKKWRASLKRYFAAVKAKGNDRVPLIRQFITGKAEDIIDEFTTTNPHASWSDLCSFLERNFARNRSAQDYMEELAHLKKLPDETFEMFEIKMQGLYPKAFPNQTDERSKEKRLMLVLRNGVDEQIRRHLLDREPKSFREAIQLASEESERLTTEDEINSTSEDNQIDPVVKKVNAIASDESESLTTVDEINSTSKDDKIDPVAKKVNAIENNIGTLEEGSDNGTENTGGILKETEGIRKRGRCKWFKASRGWGFVVPDEGGADIFVHQSVIRKDGFRSLADGERVEYIAKQSDRGMQAILVCGPGGRNCLGKKRFIFQIARRNIKCENCGQFADRIVNHLPKRPIKACFYCKSTSHLIASCPSKILTSDRKNPPRSFEPMPPRRKGWTFRGRP